jgi:hypothetical protein
VSTRAASRRDPAEACAAGLVNGVLDDVAASAASRAGQGFHARLHGGRGEHLEGARRSRAGQARLVALAQAPCLELRLGLELGAVAIVHAPQHADDDEERRADGREPQRDLDGRHALGA